MREGAVACEGKSAVSVSLSDGVVEAVVEREEAMLASELEAMSSGTWGGNCSLIGSKGPEK